MRSVLPCVFDCQFYEKIKKKSTQFAQVVQLVQIGPFRKKNCVAKHPYKSVTLTNPTKNFSTVCAQLMKP